MAPHLTHGAERYTYVQDEATFDALCAALDDAQRIAFDLETTTLHDPAPRCIVGLSFSTAVGTAWYVPIGHVAGDQLAYDDVLARLKPIFEHPDKTWIAHNIKFDSRFLRLDGITLDPARCEDSLLMAYVCQARDGLQSWGLKALAHQIWKVKLVEFQELFSSRDKHKNASQLHIDELGWYACGDADYCLRVSERYAALCDRNFTYLLERRLWPLVQRLEDRGVCVDVDFCLRTSAYLTEQADAVLAIIRKQAAAVIGDAAAASFNPNSQKQCVEVLFDGMGIEVLARSPGGLPSTNSVVLTRLAQRHPICYNIEVWRGMIKAAGKLKDEIVDGVRADGRIHTDYNQSGAGTGRFSSTSPNLQNMAKQKRWSVKRLDGSTYAISIAPRDAFVAADGYYLVELDFAAIEFVIFAALAGEQSVVDAYLRDEDVHRQTAALVLRKPESEITPAERNKAKTWNYLIVYGGSGAALSTRSGQDRAEADLEISKFYQARPRFAQLKQRIIRDAAKTHRIVTHFGREVFIAEYLDPSRQAQSKAERAAVNAVVQGSAADLHKIGLLNAEKAAAKRYADDQARLVLQTHDSQTWEVRTDVPPQEIVPLLIAAMQTDDPRGRLPRIRVDAQLGVSWGTLHPYDPSVDYAAHIPAWRRAWRAQAEALPEAPPPAPAPSVVSAEPEPISIDLRPNTLILPTHEQDLVEVLRRFPGQNLVIVATEDAGRRETLRLEQVRTSLSAQDLQAVVRAFWPQATASVDQEVIATVLAHALR